MIRIEGVHSLNLRRGGSRQSRKTTVYEDVTRTEGTEVGSTDIIPAGARITVTVIGNGYYDGTKPDGRGCSYNDKETFWLKGILQVFGTKETLYAQWVKQ